MVRPRRIRRISFQPESTYFKPAGIPLNSLAESILSFPELEAARLIDFEGKSQIETAKKMKVSQPTLSRLLKSARKKLADAIINSKAIKIQGGVFKMVTPRRGLGLGRGRAAGGRGRMGGFAVGPGGVCKCPKCGYEEAQVIGQPCMSKKCPKCGTLMTRG